MAASRCMLSVMMVSACEALVQELGSSLTSGDLTRMHAGLSDGLWVALCT